MAELYKGPESRIYREISQLTMADGVKGEHAAALEFIRRQEQAMVADRALLKACGIRDLPEIKY